MKNKIIIRNKKRVSPIKTFLTEIRTQTKIEQDYFKDRDMCYLGVNNDPRNKFQWDKSVYKNPFDDPNYQFPKDEMVYLDIDPTKFINMRILASSGVGKTTLIKNLVCDYHKSGQYNILIINPKNPEYVIAKNKGKTKRLHPHSKNEGLKVSNYCASHIKEHAEMKQFSLQGMKFYSHKISSFTQRESWMALGLSPMAGAYCSGLVKQGAKNLKQIHKQLGSSDLMYSTKASAMSRIGIAMEEGLFGKHSMIDFEKEWGEEGNIIVLNYYQKDGYLLSTDITLAVEKAREYVMKTKGTRRFKKTLIIFDDAKKYCSKLDHNEASILLVKNCQTMYRSDGIDNIVIYQNQKGLDTDIAEGSDSTLLSYIAETESISSVISRKIIYLLKATEDVGGLILDNYSYTKEWIYIPPQSREFYRFVPQGCKVGHDFN